MSEELMRHERRDAALWSAVWGLWATFCLGAAWWYLSDGNGFLGALCGVCGAMSVHMMWGEVQRYRDARLMEGLAERLNREEERSCGGLR